MNGSHSQCIRETTDFATMFHCGLPGTCLDTRLEHKLICARRCVCIPCTKTLSRNVKMKTVVKYDAFLDMLLMAPII